VNKLAQNLKDLETVVNGKVSNLRAVDDGMLFNLYPLAVKRALTEVLKQKLSGTK
jgi:hypothetical protein